MIVLYIYIIALFWVGGDGNRALTVLRGMGSLSWKKYKRDTIIKIVDPIAKNIEGET